MRGESVALGWWVVQVVPHAKYVHDPAGVLVHLDCLGHGSGGLDLLTGPGVAKPSPLQEGGELALDAPSFSSHSLMGKGMERETGEHPPQYTT